jgi:superfamily II DNA/RNA helicase
MNKYLANLGIKELNDMQKESLQTAKSSNNILLLSPTGSGKTLGFLLPLLERLNKSKNNDGIQALIIAPSRELAIQIESVFKQLGSSYKSACFYGGHEYRVELNSLRELPQVLIGTPGRLVDHLNKGNIDLSSIETLICDEFDKSLEFGFEPDIKCLVNELDALDNVCLTSATQAIEVPRFIPFHDYQKIDYLHTFKESKFTYHIVRSIETDKAEALVQLICELNNESTLVFCNHRDAVTRLGELLDDSNIYYAEFHGGLKQDEREKSLFKLKNGSVNTLLCTDLASRGLDITGIKNIIHYQIPTTQDSYIHRNGRTARIDESGVVYFVLSEKEYLPDYVDATKFTVKKLSDDYFIPNKPKWETVYLNVGKKDKINKMDIVGTFCKKGGLTKEELGLIEVRDHHAFVAVDRTKINSVLSNLKGVPIKKKKVFMSVAN